MTESLAIKTQGLTKQYGQTLAVNKLDLEIEAGQFYGLLGPNGAGKSTTIHMLTTMTAATSGDAWIAGQKISDDPVAIRRTVGLVFQDSALDRTMSIDENLQFAAAMYNLSPREADKRIDELLSVFGLQDKRKRKLVTLSGGQRRAVDIARGVLHKPKVLFLDEPTIGLDLPNRRSIWRFVEQLRRDEGMTVFLTTHYLEEAAACDHVDFFQQGQLQGGGKPHELTQQLASYILEVNTPNPENVTAQLTPIFGSPIREDEDLSFKISADDVDFHQLQQTLGDSISSMQWRKPNLNDIYLWTFCSPELGQTV
ncbi:MAG: ATP-binding cassette domain-containing protein [Gammaproteobacteria bacterium]|nr:ATP-binding cassette domain-containing protein [Gammaproteobacteria bacterium]